MQICMCTYKFVYVCLCFKICLGAFRSMCTDVFVCMYVCVCVGVCMCRSIVCVCVCMSICICMCMYVYVYVCACGMHMCVYSPVYTVQNSSGFDPSSN